MSMHMQFCLSWQKRLLGKLNLNEVFNMEKSLLSLRARMSLLFAFSLVVGCSNIGSFSRGPDTKAPASGDSTSTPSADPTTGGVNTGSVASGSGSTTTNPSPSTPGRPGGTCVQGDKVNFVFPSDVQACMNSNKIYNWVTSACTAVGNAQSYACNFDALYAAAKATLSKGTHPADPQAILDAKNKGALLIACGEKNSANVILAQWYYPATSAQIDDCNFSHNNPTVISACYRYFPDGNQPADSSDPAVLQQRVQDCLNL